MKDNSRIGAFLTFLSLTFASLIILYSKQIFFRLTVSNSAPSLDVGLLVGERLVHCYANLYAQARVDTLDALDNLPQLSNAAELKSKILFSVIVVRKIKSFSVNLKNFVSCDILFFSVIFLFGEALAIPP